MSDEEMLTGIYRHFNVRNIDAVLAHMAGNVDWPNGMEGGRVHGHDQVRAYWTRQWKMLDPHVEPVGFRPESSGTLVEVHQVVRDLAGNLLLDQMVHHVYRIQDGLIQSMEIRPAIPS